MDAEKCCGYAAAFVSIVAFGTFAVPIKSEAARKVSVDPLGTSVGRPCCKHDDAHMIAL